MYPTFVSPSAPPGPVAVSVTVYVPGTVYECVGLVALLVGVPSPKFQLYDVAVPVVRFVKVTDSGAAPVVGVPLKSATGGGGFAVMYAVFTSGSEPPGPVTV